MKQNYIRYTDIMNASNKTKYTGTVQTISGNVVEVTKPEKGFEEITVDASSAEVDKTYDVIAHTNKKIREDDTLSIGVIVAGPAKYFNSDGKAIHCVAGVAVSDEILNAGNLEN